ncbi:hypothetical protein ABT297_26860 [Dactylosporangium sp. NPDC000555]
MSRPAGYYAAPGSERGTGLLGPPAGRGGPPNGVGHERGPTSAARHR